VLSYVQTFLIASVRPKWLANGSSRFNRNCERRLEPMTRIELVTSSLPRTRSAN
jgi:hypothetical protein